jgi:hypothetical protein
MRFRRVPEYPNLLLEDRSVIYITVCKAIPINCFDFGGDSRMFRIACRFLLTAALMCVGCTWAQAEVRVALVIGNGAYQNVPRLVNPANDANDVAAALKRDGFDTILATDLNKDQMDEATIKFAKAARTADVAMFYYSGHALQFAGVNYLAPVDATLTDEADLRRFVRVDEIVSDLQQAKNLRILVLDACRDNPLADQLRRSIGGTRAIPLQRGLAKIDTPLGMIVSFSTQAGTEAADGSGRNSPYTAAFLKEIEKQGEIGTIFRRISTDVYEATDHRQLPELSLSLIGEFYLRGKPDGNVSPGESKVATISPSPEATPRQPSDKDDAPAASGDRYLAIAVSKSGMWGVGLPPGASSRLEAVMIASSNCERKAGEGCGVATWVKNGCAALAHGMGRGNKVMGWSTMRPEIGDARSLAVDDCLTMEQRRHDYGEAGEHSDHKHPEQPVGQGTCEVVWSGCTGS